MNLEEYVNAYYGGLLGISKEYGISKAEDPMDTDKTAYFNTMYGAKVFSQLNNESDIFKLLPKQPWNTSGYRILTDRSAGTAGTPPTGTGGLAEGAVFPEADTPDLLEISLTMKEIVTAWDITTRASVLSRADDGLGDIEGFLKDNAATDHAFYIDQMLCAANPVLTAANLESLDRIVANGAEADLTGTSSSIAANDLDVYGDNTNFNREGSDSSWFMANVSTGTVGSNLAVAKVLALSDIDDLISSALENGAKYEDLIILTGYDTLEQLKRRMTGDTANWRLMMEAQAPRSEGGVKSQPGMNLDTRVGYYDSIPMFVSQHVPVCGLGGTTAGVGGGTTIGSNTAMSNLYILDMSNLHLRLAVPTTYVSNEDLGVTQKLAREYAFITGGELVCTKFNTQGKIRDLKQG